ncbi:steroid membrane binding protein [Naegleria gruberi]|uniref:Steroid membrane binding protein n=1 Tax=Naegleria gruberi TaxID=5762 RepID=D2VL20_NAEGR|nr:steroid membrane binding protein [Naegleria gruberi]EFC42546.1 steroid membrane binding protein [Naegleria gruberi]|eukprot:XP_002675290.1 steroid membrane binding protein [Naegleria gruberi strain NEG-M]
MDLTTVLIIAVFIVGAVFIYNMYSNQSKGKTASGDAYSSSSDSDSDEEEEKIEEREFTLEELHTYNGVESSTNPNKKIYVSVLGKIFDVTGSGFYGPNETYDMFAGHESSVALAKNELKPSLLDQLDISSLGAFEKDNLYGMYNHFEMKYRVVGWLKEWEDMNKKDK